MNVFTWKVIKKETGDAWVMYENESLIYFAIIHPELHSKKYYVDVFSGNKLRYEFLEEDLDVAKLKAEIKASEFLKIKLKESK